MFWKVGQGGADWVGRGGAGCRADFVQYHRDIVRKMARREVEEERRDWTLGGQTDRQTDEWMKV